ncbi:imelysin family protein [Litoribrevibacter albus]|uniref:Imelysin-like domain-containing protein n=1 Tax=Litoribrevibacter albus TaxID=1473156 RepID=A0AA37W4J4_9GAMM|nr:imelysin family protein [Litoribrevibacter albus]GLQ29770.1 hypothetical protein GCM10007876_02480 [Litoribrevibacter albus]
MPKYKWMISKVGLFLALVSSGVSASDWQPTVETVTKEVIRPGYAHLASSFEALGKQADGFCTQPSEASYQQVQAAWKEAILAWMGVSWIHFGPISSGSARFDIQIWPIRKGITHKKVQSLLANTQLSTEDVDKSGVSVRGLTGSEYLLFSGSGGQLAQYQDESAKNRCIILGQAIANGHKSALALSKAWQTEEVISPFKQGVDMLDQAKEFESSASIVWNALLSEIEFIQLRKLEGPVNPHAKKAKPTQAESWRSEHSFNNIKHGLESLKQLYVLGFQKAIASQSAEMNTKVIQGFDQLIAEVAGFEQPMVLMLKDSSGRDRLKAYDRKVHEFYSFLRNDVTPLTGFVLGFNANDGD